MVRRLTPPSFVHMSHDLLIPIKANQPMMKSQCFCITITESEAHPLYSVYACVNYAM